jgi:hypothetical protein
VCVAATIKRHPCLVADRGSARAVRVSIRPGDQPPRGVGLVVSRCHSGQRVRESVVLLKLGVCPASLVHCFAARYRLRCACIYSGGDPEHRLIPISSCCGSRLPKVAISLRALEPSKEAVSDSAVISKILCALLPRKFTGELPRKITGELPRKITGELPRKITGEF